MRGVITGRDLVRHAVAIVRLWGVSTYLRCLRAAVTGKPSTFLGVLYPPRGGPPDASPRWRPIA